jgi:hypothetical protein
MKHLLVATLIGLLVTVAAFFGVGALLGEVALHPPEPEREPCSPQAPSRKRHLAAVAG